MFDDPKKALERLQEQLLAAEDPINEDPEDLLEEIYEQSDEDEVFDNELETLLNGGTLHRGNADRDVSRRATGYDADEYEMDTSRYVPVPKKKRSGCLTAFVLFLAILVAALAGWALWRVL